MNDWLKKLDEAIKPESERVKEEKAVSQVKQEQLRALVQKAADDMMNGLKAAADSMKGKLTHEPSLIEGAAWRLEFFQTFVEVEPRIKDCRVALRDENRERVFSGDLINMRIIEEGTHKPIDPVEEMGALVIEHAKKFKKA